MEKQNQAEIVDARRPCFFELFSSNLSSQRLKIPVKFIKHLEGKKSGSVSLIGPSGNVWPVDLIQLNDHLFLDHGWPTFVQDHLIECGDLLVFRYDGDSHFTVLVFDPSACEKDSAFHSKCSEDPSRFRASMGHKREREEEEASSSDNNFDFMSKKAKGRCFDFLSDCVGTKEKVGLATNDNRGCWHNDENMNKRCQDAAFHQEVGQCRSLPECPVMPSELKSCSEKPEAAVHGRNGNKDEANLSDRSPISSVSEREKEKRVAQSFISCYPYFVRIMKKFNVSGSYTLNIPYQFSMAHLPDCKTEIVLRTVKGACWTVNSVPTTRVHTSHTFCGGWMAFVRNNDIKMGDICIFELVRKFEMRVFILRVGKDSPENQIAKPAPLNTATAAMPHKIEVCPKKSRRKVLSKIIKKADVCTKKSSKKRTRKHDNAMKGSANTVPCSRSRTGNEKQGAVTKSQKNAEVGAGLRMMVAMDEAKVAKSFISGFPNFVRIMRKFNVSGSYTLKIPHQFSAAHLPNCKTEMILCNLQGEHWTVNSVPDSKGRTVHTFCGGWMAFVRGNDVQIGDICMFELVSPFEMHVHISRVGQKALENQCGKPAATDLPLGPLSSNHSPSICNI